MSERKRERSCPRFGQDFSAGGMTKQSFRAQCDVNTIVEKARATGLVSHVNSKKPSYMDCTAVPDYMSALNIVQTASDTFATLSAKVRERFQNDPGRLMSFLADPANTEEAIKLGLFVKKEVPVEKVTKVEVVNPAKPDVPGSTPKA